MDRVLIIVEGNIIIYVEVYDYVYNAECNGYTSVLAVEYNRPQHPIIINTSSFFAARCRGSSATNTVQPRASTIPYCEFILRHQPGLSHA